MELMEVWWPLVVFTFFMCLAGGIFAMQGFLTIRQKGKDLQFATLIATVITFIIGGIGVFMHLQHWDRMFNGFGHITSPITHEFIGVVVFAVVLIAYYMFMRRSETGVPPKWCAIAAIVVGLALPMLCGHSYMMVADPTWNTPLLILFYFADTLLLGSLTVFIIAKIKHVEEVLGLSTLLALVGAAGRLIIIFVYTLVISVMGSDYVHAQYYFDPTLPDISKIDTSAYTGALLTGDLAWVFWLFIIIIGSIVPLLAILYVNRKGGTGAAATEGTASEDSEGNEGAKKTSALSPLAVMSVALVCAVVGGILWRCALYWVCIKVFPYFSYYFM